MPCPSVCASATAGVAPAASATATSVVVAVAADAPTAAPTSSGTGSPVTPLSSAPPDGSLTRRPSESSVYLRCHQSSRASTTGTSAKLYAGGGDGIDHSSERASHGSGPATSPRFAE